MSGDKPYWFADHEKDDDRRFADIIARLEEIKKNDEEWRAKMDTKLDPISDAFKTLTGVGRWGKALLALLAVVLTIVLTAKQLVR